MNIIDLAPQALITPNGTFSYLHLPNPNPSVRPMIFLNGFKDTYRDWNPILLEPLTQKFELFFLNHRNVGLTRSLRSLASLADYAQDVLEFINSRSWKHKPIVLGHSMGSAIALEAGKHSPDCIGGLILSAGRPGGKLNTPMNSETQTKLNTIYPDEASQRQATLELLFPEKDWEKIRKSSFFRPQRPEDEFIPESTIQEQIHARRHYLDNFTAQGLTFPFLSLILAGNNDHIAPFANALTLCELIPKSILVRFPGCGHAIQWQEPEMMAQVILANFSAQEF